MWRREKCVRSVVSQKNQRRLFTLSRSLRVTPTRSVTPSAIPFSTAAVQGPSVPGRCRDADHHWSGSRGREVTTEAYAAIPTIVREKILEIAMTRRRRVSNGNSCGVNVAIGRSRRTSRRVWTPRMSRGSSRPRRDRPAGRRDQGLDVRLPTTDTPELMPLPIALAIGCRVGLPRFARTARCPYLRPDGKTR